jgi:hypothetical protein
MTGAISKPHRFIYAPRLRFRHRPLLVMTRGPLKLWTPTLSTLDWRVVVLSALSGFLLLKQYWSILSVLAAASTLALTIRFLGI